MSDKKYVRITDGLYDKGKLVEADKIDEHVNSSKDFYVSTYYYGPEHLEHFKKHKSIAGIVNLKSDKIWFDFDHKDFAVVRKDATTLVQRLEKNGIKRESIQVFFSGSKGVHVVVETNTEFTRKEIETVCRNLSKGMESFDPSLYDYPQLLRVAGTKHQKTKNYKVPMSLDQLEKAEYKDILTYSSNLNNVTENFDWTRAEIPKTLTKEEPVVITTKPSIQSETSLDELKSTKPRHWSLHKWCIANALGLKVGERNNSMMVTAATARALGYPREIAESFLQQLDRKYASATSQDENPGEIKKTLNSVFSDKWKGGQYTTEDLWIKGYCQRVGIKIEKEDSRPFIGTDDIFTTFNDFSKNFNKNLIKTGIKELDENALFMTSTHNGILGQPGSGKTSLSLQWLAHASQNNNNALFYSLDMGKPIIYGKLLQSITGLDFRSAVNKFKNEDAWARIQHEKIKNNWTDKVKFNFKSGMTIEQIRDDIKRQEDSTGEKTRLLLVDYLECLQGPYSDATANTGYISNQLKDLANEMEICSVLLLQTQKHSTPDISDPLLSMKQIKGASLIEQAMSAILTIWREGYSPRTVDQDRYLSMAIVKNRFGSLWSDDFLWDGKMGLIHEINDEGRANIEELRKFKKENKIKESKDSGWS